MQRVFLEYHGCIEERSHSHLPEVDYGQNPLTKKIRKIRKGKTSSKQTFCPLVVFNFQLDVIGDSGEAKEKEVVRLNLDWYLFTVTQICSKNLSYELQTVNT